MEPLPKERERRLVEGRMKLNKLMKSMSEIEFSRCPTNQAKHQAAQLRGKSINSLFFLLSRCARQKRRKELNGRGPCSSSANQAFLNWREESAAGKKRNQIKSILSFIYENDNWLICLFFLELWGPSFKRSNSNNLMVPASKNKWRKGNQSLSSIILLNEWWKKRRDCLFPFPAAHSNQQFKNLLIVDGGARPAEPIKEMKRQLGSKQFSKRIVGAPAGVHWLIAQQTTPSINSLRFRHTAGQPNQSNLLIQWRWIELKEDWLVTAPCLRKLHSILKIQL